MDKELIERLVSEAKLDLAIYQPSGLKLLISPDKLARFASLIAEECAKVAERNLHSVDGLNIMVPAHANLFGEHDRATRTAAAIRAKFCEKL